MPAATAGDAGGGLAAVALSHLRRVAVVVVLSREPTLRRVAAAAAALAALLVLMSRLWPGLAEGGSNGRGMLGLAPTPSGGRGPSSGTTLDAAAPEPDALGRVRALIDSRHPTPGVVLAYADELAAAAPSAPPPAQGAAGGHRLDAELRHDAITPDMILDTVYPTFRDRYPHVLTYKPVVDCDHGRYITVGFEYGGFGVSTGVYIRKLMYILPTNLTAVFEPFFSAHPDESPEAQNDFWRFDDWEVRAADLERCPPESAVRRNQLDLTQRPEDLLTLRPEIMDFASSLYWANRGGIVRLKSHGFSHAPRDQMRAYFLSAQWLLEIRWNCRNNPYGDNYLRPGLLAQARSEAPLSLDMSIHVRRGDIMNKTTGAPLPEWADRYRPLGFYMDAANELLAILDGATPGLPRMFLTITIYSEGDLAYFRPLVQNLTRQGYRTAVNLDTKTSRVFARMAESEVNVLTVRSAFSHYFRFHLHRLRVGSDNFDLTDLSSRRDLSAAAGFTVGGYDFHSPDPADPYRVQRIRTQSVRLWQFLLEWKLRRAERYRQCASFTLRCILSNPYALSPLGPISLRFLGE